MSSPSRVFLCAAVLVVLGGCSVDGIFTGATTYGKGTACNVSVYTNSSTAVDADEDEVAALNAFDQAIQSGSDPEEALSAAIAAAEAINPSAFGLTQGTARPIDNTGLACDISVGRRRQEQ